MIENDFMRVDVVAAGTNKGCCEIKLEGLRELPTVIAQIICYDCIDEYRLRINKILMWWRHKILKRPLRHYLSCKGCANNFNEYLPKWEEINEVMSAGYPKIRISGIVSGTHSPGTPLNIMEVSDEN